MELNIEKIIKELSQERKVFHSEADFQFSLAWKIKEIYPEAKIGLEYRSDLIPNIHLDILVDLNGKIIPIELKYVTKGCKVVCNNEVYSLSQHAAQPIRRYDFIKDIERVETCKSNLKGFTEGYSIMITNDSAYYKEQISSKETICNDFRINEGVTATGTLSWKNEPSIGTIKGREKSIILSNKYNFNWNEYCTVEEMEFKLLIVKVV